MEPYNDRGVPTCMWQMTNNAPHCEPLPTDQAGGCTAMVSLCSGVTWLADVNDENNSLRVYVKN